LIDCYCCVASTGWAFAQVCFFLKSHQCSEKVPKTSFWLQIEVIYQYSQILYYLISNFIVIAIIIYLQQRPKGSQKNKSTRSKSNILPS
jgi:large-conductance mechanosensitive channel